MSVEEIATLALLYGKLEEVDLETVDVIDVYAELTTTRSNLYEKYFDTQDKQLEDLYMEIIETIDKLLESVRDPDIDLTDDQEG